jgi:hypothetical protein
MSHSLQHFEIVKNASYILVIRMYQDFINILIQRKSVSWANWSIHFQQVHFIGKRMVKKPMLDWWRKFKDLELGKNDGRAVKGMLGIFWFYGGVHFYLSMTTLLYTSVSIKITLEKTDLRTWFVVIVIQTNCVHSSTLHERSSQTSNLKSLISFRLSKFI